MAGQAGRAGGNTIALWVLAVVATLFFLREADQLLIPIVVGVLISYALEPVVGWLERHAVPRMAGTTLVMLVLVGLLSWGAYSLKDNVQQALDALPQVVQKAREIAASVGVPMAAAQPTQAQGGEGSTGSATGFVQRGLASALCFAGNVVVVVFLVFFLLLSRHHVRQRIVEISGPDSERRKTAATIVDEINGQVQRFLLVRLVTAVIVGVLTWVVLAWMNVQNAAFWGILAGVFNSIPYFGPVIVSGGLFAVGLLQDGDVVRALQMSGAALAITSLEGWLLTPPLMGKAERMSALAVFLGLLLWTWVWGPWGTLLAVPMLVVVKSIADHVDRLKPIGRVLAP